MFFHQIIGATEEVFEEEEIIEETVGDVINLEHQFVETASGIVKIEHEDDFEDNIIYR